MSENYIPTHLIRHNPGMIRDCWLEKNGEERVLAIRQVRFNPDGAEPECKIIRLVGEEIEKLKGLLA